MLRRSGRINVRSVWAWVRPVLRWTTAGAFMLLSWRSLVLAMFHIWAADFPPKPIAEWHANWANVFLVGILLCWACAASAIWLLRPGREQARRTQVDAA